MSKQNINVALIGNPNVGKTSVFNQLTGLNQQVGNYPGITVEKKVGFCKLPNNIHANVVDLPGTYSSNASSADENVVIELLLNKNDKLYPDVIVVVSEVENLKRNLLLFTQIGGFGNPNHSGHQHDRQDETQGNFIGHSISRISIEHKNRAGKFQKRHRNRRIEKCDYHLQNHFYRTLPECFLD